MPPLRKIKKVTQQLIDVDTSTRGRIASIRFRYCHRITLSCGHRLVVKGLMPPNVANRSQKKRCKQCVVAQ